MKIQTNQGEVELTAEMVCRGMVFAPKDPRDYALGEGRVFVVGSRDEAYDVFWRDARNGSLGTNALNADRLLGCDPTIASRADCERFGVHGDAAAHGFARLRDGGALDLRRHLPGGWVIQNASGTYNAGIQPWQLPEGARFVGLAARLASQDDVRRLCCGAEPAYEDLAPCDGCTLAIGDHDTHEDLATGMKWSAKPQDGTAEDVQRRVLQQKAVDVFRKSQPRGCPDCHASEGQRCADDCARVARYKATRCGARPVCGQVLVTSRGEDRIATGKEECDREFGSCPTENHRCSADFQMLQWAGEPRFLNCPICAARVMPYAVGPVCSFGVFDPKIGKTRESAVCEACFKDHGSNVAALRWEGDRLVVNRPQSGRAFTREQALCECGALGPDIADHLHAKGCATVRKRRETPLVALVNAVPEGLDPVGWRAAVLAYFEHAQDSRKVGLMVAPTLLPQLIRGEVAIACYAHVVAAYHRAIAPRAKVAPERRGATWKTRGPALPVDDGRDDD
jgi:hypothetical protein